MRPAAGPEIVTNVPEILEPMSPPTMAVIKPASGGTPEAIAIPKQSGNAISETLNPEERSSLKWAFNPAKPVFGIVDLSMVFRCFCDSTRGSQFYLGFKSNSKCREIFGSDRIEACENQLMVYKCWDYCVYKY